MHHEMHHSIYKMPCSSGKNAFLSGVRLPRVSVLKIPHKIKEKPDFMRFPFTLK